MLKLSKISKVILFSGMLLAFSCVNQVAFAADDDASSTTETEDTSKSFSQGQADRAKNKADKSRSKANEAQQAYDDAIKGTDGNAGWQQASDKKNAAQNSYSKANLAYNQCVAEKGAAGCSGEKKAMEQAKGELDEATKEYNKEQKEASKAYYENQKAQEKAAKKEEKAAQKQKKADEKALRKAERELEKCEKDLAKGKVADCKDKEAAVTEAQKKVDSHTKAGNMDTSAASAEIEKYSNVLADPNASAYDKEVAMNSLRKYAADKKDAAAAATKDCERYSAMTSKDAQAKAQQACALAKKLEAEAALAEEQMAANATSIEEKYSESITSAEKRLKTVSAGANSALGVVDISGGGREISMSGSDANSFSGYRSEYFNYKGGGDVLEVVTRRAALAVVSLKPIVYIFAGFGLIAFAWMAIFNKISWKWFANIAMGLFLVANMGRLIEYFVGNGNSSGGYYIGAWADGAKKGNANSRLANATKDIYHVYGEVGYNDKGIREWTIQDAKTPEMQEASVFEASARGFCQGTSGSGWANFTSCVNDIVSTTKKAVDTVKTVAATVEDMEARYYAVKDNVQNVIQAAKNMEGASVGEIFANAGIILNNVNSAFSTTTGALGSMQNAISSVSNNIQDMGKSTDEQKELNDRRARGEATNAVDAAMKGQEWDSTNKGVENVDGKYAGDKNGWNKFMDGVNDATQKSNQLNNQLQEGVGLLGAGASAVENFSVFGSKSINEARQEKQAAKAEKAKQEERDKYINEQNRQEAERQQRQEAEHNAYLETNAGKNETYHQAEQSVNNLQNDLNMQKNEQKLLENEVRNAQAAVDKACQDPSSVLCEAAKTTLELSQDALKSKQDQISATEEAYNTAVENRNAAQKEALDSNIEESTKNLEAANKAAKEICAEDAGSKACADARQKAADEAKKLTNYINERDGESDERLYKQQGTTPDENTEKNSNYMSSVDEANRLYDDMKQQEQDIKNLENDVKNANKAVEENCKGESDNSALCKAARSDLKMSQDALAATQDLAEQTKKDYADAKTASDAAYKEVLDSNINKAEKDLEAAQTKAEEACAANAASKECSNARKEAKKASETLSSYIDERENKTGETRLNSHENIDNQMVIDQYKTQTNPNAVAQASKGDYMDSKNKASLAQESLRAKENQTKAAKKEYEAALKAAQASGSAEDLKKAERLKQSYELAVSEEKAATDEYAAVERELKVAEAEYKEKAAASELYMQEVYTGQMKAAASNINKYEKAMVEQRKVVENIAARYTEALSGLDANNAADQLKVAQLYKEYNDAKKLYIQYQSSLNQARKDYNTAQKNYQNSVAAYKEYTEGK